MGMLICFWFGWPVLAIFDLSGASEPGTITKIRYCWMGSLAIMAGALWMLAIGEWMTGRLAGSAACKPEHANAEPDKKVESEAMGPRRVRALVLIAFYVVLTVIAVGAGHDKPRLVRVTIPMPGLPQCLSGYQVAMLSDVHGGPLVGLSDVGMYVAQLNALEADAELLVGDLADGPPTERGDELAPVRELNAPDGAFYVTGNHEYYHGSTGNDWLRWMESQPTVTVLNNTGVTLPVRDRRLGRFPDCQDADTFDLLGVVDRTACRNDPSLCEEGFGTRVNLAVAAAKAKLKPEQAAQLGTPDRASLLLAHQPLDADSAASAGLTAQVAGHTHGGQIWPIHWSTYLGNKGRVSGGFAISREGDSTAPMHLYVNEGAVGWGPRLRLWAQTEITLLTLVPAKDEVDEPEPLVVDASHPSQIGGLFASVLLIASVGQFCISKSVVGFHLLTRAQKLSSSETALVQMSEMPTTSSAETNHDSSIP
jgi:predicted MPP superfamily phosphohydrolase